MEKIFKNELQWKKLINEIKKDFKKGKLKEIYHILYENSEILNKNLPEGGYPNNSHFLRYLDFVSKDLGFLFGYFGNGEKIKKLPKQIQKILDYDFHYTKGGKILKGNNF